MKRIYIILSILSVLTLFTACNKDYEIGYTPIHPLGGEYTIDVFRTENGETTTVTKKYWCLIGNTTHNDKDLCWVRVGGLSFNQIYAINGKVSCSVKDLTFQGTDIENLAGNVPSSEDRFTLTGGKVILNGGKAPSGTIVDTIEFSYTTSRDPNAVYKVTGYRYTGWTEDQ